MATTIDDAAEAMRRLGDVLSEFDIAGTIERGWPEDFGPMISQAYDEADMIIAAADELAMHLPEITDEQRWTIAGNIVARFRRDLLAESP